MRRTKIHAPVVNLPVLNGVSRQILPENPRRIGLLINNYGTAEAYLFDEESPVIAGRGFSIFPGFGLAIMRPDTCPQSKIFAGQVAAGAVLHIMEIVDDRHGIPDVT